MTEFSAVWAYPPTEGGLATVADTGRLHIGVEIGFQVVMRRHFMTLAAFLMQPHPPALALGVVVLDAHGDDGADASEGEGHDSHQRTVAWPDDRRNVDAVRQSPRLFGIQNRGLAGLHDMLRPADRVRRDGGEDLAGNEPVEQLTEGSQVLLAVGSSKFVPSASI